MKKKTIALALVLVMAFGATMGGTFAYLTSQTEVVTNTFTVGNVTITLDEVEVDEYGVAAEGAARVKANEYKLIPGHNYTKDPTVHVADGSEDAWLFVKVENGIADIEADTTIVAQMKDNGWAAVEGVAGVYAYNTKVSAGDNIVVFETFTLKGDAEVATFAEETITVQAYAIQADGFAGAAAAWAAAPWAAAPLTTWTTPAQG